MSAYLEPILTSAFVFPVLAFIITIPYLIYEYRKFGSVLIFRTLIIYSFILYLLTSYFLVILPLPPKSLVLHYTSPTVQLQLGRFIKDILVTTSLVWNQPSTYLSFFKSSTVYTVLFNLFLTLPFGIYLRYYYQKKWYQVIIYSFLLSLFFEVTQLTGLYGIYPRSYRLFDVDDLLINTLGGFLGFLLTPLITKMLPTRESLDTKALQKGKKVSLFRRGFAYFIDFMFLIFVVGILSFLTNSIDYSSLFFYYLIGAFVFFILIPLIFNGFTFGKWVLKIRVQEEENNHLMYYQIILRYVLLHFVILPTPYYLKLIWQETLPNIIQIMCSLILGINYLSYIIQIFRVVFGKRERFGYEIVSHTKEESTILS